MDSTTAVNTRAGKPRIASIAVVYAACLLQGLALVSFPAVSAVLTREYGFSDAQYGAIFLPQLTFAVIGALVGGSLARKISLKTILLLSLLINGLSQVLLAGVAWFPNELAFPLVLAGTAALGLGFGLSGAPINSYPPILFPRHASASVVAAHTLIGVGLALGPILAGQAIAANSWSTFPVCLIAMSAVLMAATLMTALPRDTGTSAAEDINEDRPVTSGVFWLFIAIAVLYAFAEGTFANWVVIYLNEARGIAEATANEALSLFWAAMVAGRLIISALLTKIPPTKFWLMLPVFMIVAFLALPLVNSAWTGIALFAFAGIACSAFFPLTIAIASQRFPHHVAWVSSMMIAALMVGVGIGSFAVGAMREMLSFEALYRLSALYPVLVLLLAIPVVRGLKRR
jgi:fucose permease